MHSIVFDNSSTASGDITALRDIGVTIDQYGTVRLDETKYDAAIQTQYDDIVTMLTADTSSQNLYESTSMGLAQDVATILKGFTDSTGMVTSRETTTTKELQDHEDALVNLEQRMDVVYSRYLQQFGAMESLMATLDSTKNYLTAQFESLSKAYDSD
jgi:flagellar hook-associated protein 2